MGQTSKFISGIKWVILSKVISLVRKLTRELGSLNVSLSKVEYVVPPEDGSHDIVLSDTPPIAPPALLHNFAGNKTK
ncbi:hypothetical protein [Segetibacter koreensis]|uniref:hypothetical protein n=1 Tax=Segetibacter koreensis TaxID=398037 RepID=UPI00035F4F04|nr:hypothetical protein [Segetibacter koreensis]